MTHTWYDNIFALLAASGGLPLIASYTALWITITFNKKRSGFFRMKLLSLALFLIANISTEIAFVTRGFFSTVVFISLIDSLNSAHHRNVRHAA